MLLFSLGLMSLTGLIFTNHARIYCEETFILSFLYLYLSCILCSLLDLVRYFMLWWSLRLGKILLPPKVTQGSLVNTVAPKTHVVFWFDLFMQESRQRGGILWFRVLHQMGDVLILKIKGEFSKDNPVFTSFTIFWYDDQICLFDGKMHSCTEVKVSLPGQINLKVCYFYPFHFFGFSHSYNTYIGGISQVGISIFSSCTQAVR